MATAERDYRRPLVLWGGTVGFALGAIIDVVVFHMVFQHHYLLSGSIDPHSYDGLQSNVMYDGLFLAVMIGILGLGVAMVWRTVNRARVALSARFVGGAVLVGAGVFNVFDGVVSHYVLDIHNVVHNTEAWNPHWVAVSLVLLGAGVAVLFWADGPVSEETVSDREVE